MRPSHRVESAFWIVLDFVNDQQVVDIDDVAELLDGNYPLANGAIGILVRLNQVQTWHNGITLIVASNCAGVERGDVGA